MQAEINRLDKELLRLRSVTTNCNYCDNKMWNKNHCYKHGDIPAEFINQTTCPDWTFDDIPF